MVHGRGQALLPRGEEQEKSVPLAIRPARLDEAETIREIHMKAFGEEEGPSVSQLSVDLLADETAEPRLILVAEDAGEAVGCVIFSNVQIEGTESVAVSILAPLAVVPRWHGQGVGAALVRHGLDLLKSRGVDLVLVLGDPRYYSRFGFRAGHGIAAPYDLPYPEAWMALEFTPGLLDRVAGVARCATMLSAPEHW